MPPASCRLRRGRHSVAGQVYLLTVCCHQKNPLLVRECAANIVLDSVHWLDRRERIELLVVMVMPDHMHLTVRLVTEPLDALMRNLKSYTAHQINRVLGRDGPVWQQGYHDRGIHDEKGVRAAVDYCLQNPVRAGLVDDFRQYPFWWCCWDV